MAKNEALAKLQFYRFSMSQGLTFRNALQRGRPLQVIGSMNALTAKMAEKAGFSALYLSGAGVSNSSYGMPDLGMINLDNVLIDLRRMRGASKLPILVDIDTGFGNHLMLRRTIRELEDQGAAGVHIEDQVFEKRCGHREGKELVSAKEMTRKIKEATNERKDPSFFIIARTDALQVEGFEKTLLRAKLYADEGADAIFAEAFTSLDQYKKLKETVRIPILANQTEFGKTPLFSLEELKRADVDIVLYPLSVNRAMNKAAWELLHAIKQNGTQKAHLSDMQTREELYRLLDYEIYEKLQDEWRKENS